MLGRKRLKTQDDSLDRVLGEFLLTAKVSDEEIEAAANSPTLYEGLRLRIEQRQRAGERALAANRRPPARVELNPIRALLDLRRSWRWALAAVAVLLTAATLLWLPKLSRESTEIARPALPHIVPSSPPPADSSAPSAQQESPRLAAIPWGPRQPHPAVHRRRRSNSRADEVATDFLPLTFTADSTMPESGHVVRVKISRTALIAFGLPMNAQRAGELIKADVVIGDDGLARAIRFIQ